MRLEISQDNGTTWAILWMKAGNQGNSWHSYTVDLSAYQSEHVLFRFVSATNAGTKSNMAIDQLQIKSADSFYIGGFNPVFASEKRIINITGEGFKTVEASNVVMFNGVPASVLDATTSNLTVLVPTGATTGKVTVETNTQITSIIDFTVVPSLLVGEVAPASGIAGTEVTISGAGFDHLAVNNVVKFNGVLAIVTEATTTSLKVLVPPEATTGKVTVEANRQTRTSTTSFTVIPTLSIKEFTPVSGIAGSEVIIRGKEFGVAEAGNIVKFNGIVATVTEATATSLKVLVPTGATTGKVTIEAKGQTTTSANDFVVFSALSITGFTPFSGIVGDEVTITGTGFASKAVDNVVKFNETIATVTEVTPTSLKAIVPLGAATGKITIETNKQTASGTADFSVSLVSGIAQNSAQKQFIGYPNPLVDVLNIKLLGNASQLITVQLYNLHGQLVTMVRKHPENDALQVPVKNLASGVYTVKITADNKIFTYKVMKL